ncbi:hypothetical protein [Anaerohalosphaera lusitana]|uniref:hypothetical protein n=1 Tax=Anaerohalosphaera lusitana TaxID=1936003 RepID=UPI0011BA6C02|nr:hypothetical protein [Anaerohalosphaera lusitana]
MGDENGEEVSLIRRTEVAQVETDWMINDVPQKASVWQDGDDEIVLGNGLIERRFKLAPNCATVAFDNLMTTESILRAVRPEAVIVLDGIEFDVGGLIGQPNHAYLTDEWIQQMQADPKAFQFVNFEIGETKKPFDWKVTRYCTNKQWPAPGVSLRLDFEIDKASLMNRNSKLLGSSVGRELLFSDEFDLLDNSWSVHAASQERSSFSNEGKVGEIYTPANTALYAEKDLPKGTRLVVCFIDPGTDDSATWGPGMAIVWDEHIVKFNIRPGKKQFGITHNGSEQFAGRAKPGQAYYLRMRLDGGKVHCEASEDADKWFSVGSVVSGSSNAEPRAVRIGKMDARGGGNDYGQAGDWVRLHVDDFAAYGQFNADKLGDEFEQLKTLTDVKVSVHYELYDGLPLLSKWITVTNGADRYVRLNSFTSEVLAAVEPESVVGDRGGAWMHPNIHVESEYEFHGMDAKSANEMVHWVEDPQYKTQVSYGLKTPCLLKVEPRIGPDVLIGAGEEFVSPRTFELVHDSRQRERKGLQVRRMYRTVAPWITENPIMMHVRFADWDSVKRAVDQCAEVGFEMVILTFGSGFNIENESEEYLAKMKKMADYAHSKGIELGGYSLLASRRISDEHDVVNPETGKPGGFATFGNSPCLESEWGQDYFRKLYQFYEETGFDLLEHDGSYPGDVCASKDHPGHEGLGDSQWKQWKKISDFYKWCRGRGIYLNVPDYYFLTGSNRTGMGYREVNWSLPREQQIIHARQNIYDGTWTKTPSMGWMFVPLTQYHGGGAAATIEPLSEHLDAYEAHMANLFTTGVQACYRGPRLYDTDETKDAVKRWVSFYKQYRELLDSDIIHVRRADGRDLDCMMSVNHRLDKKAMIAVFNPTDDMIEKTITIPMYYTGLDRSAEVTSRFGKTKRYRIDRQYDMELPVSVGAGQMMWYLVE